jgi:hypothetical protein
MPPETDARLMTARAGYIPPLQVPALNLSAVGAAYMPPSCLHNPRADGADNGRELVFELSSERRVER